MDISRISVFTAGSATLFLTLGIRLLLVVVFVILVLVFVKRSLRYFQEKIQEHNGYDEQVVSFSHIVGDVFFFLALIISAALGLHIAGFQSVYLILGATFATGYAFKELFQNVVAGILIITTKEFTLGDLVEVYVDDVIHFWRIDSIAIRYTVLRRLDMTRVIIPNRLLTRVPVITFSSEEDVRLQTGFRISSAIRITNHFTALKEKIMALESVTEKESTLLVLESFHHGMLLVTIYFYFDPNAGKLRFRVISEVNSVVADYFTEHGIAFGYTHSALSSDYHDNTLVGLVEQYQKYRSI